MSVLSYSFYSLPFERPKWENELSIPSIKTPKQEKGKNILKLLFLFPFIPSPPSKQGLKLNFKSLDLGFSKKKNPQKNGLLLLLYVYEVLF